MHNVHPSVAGLALIASCIACGPPPAAAPETSETGSTAHVESPESDAIVVAFGAVARAEPRLTVQGAQPLIDYLDEVTPYRVELRLGQSSEDVELDPGMQDLVTFLEERLVEATPLGVLSYSLADERFGADVLAQTLNDDGAPLERAVFVTARDSEVSSIEDLEGRQVALGASHSMVSHVLGVHELERTGVSARTRNFASDAAVVEAVVTGTFDAGVISEHEADDTVRVIHASVAIPSRPIVVRADLPEAVRAALGAALFDLGPHPEWDRLFRNGFAPPTEDAYSVARAILNDQSTRCAGSCHEPVRFGDRR